MRLNGFLVCNNDLLMLMFTSRCAYINKKSVYVYQQEVGVRISTRSRCTYINKKSVYVYQQEVGVRISTRSRCTYISKKSVYVYQQEVGVRISTRSRCTYINKTRNVNQCIAWFQCCFLDCLLCCCVMFYSTVHFCI